MNQCNPPNHKSKRGRPTGDHESKRNELLKAVVELLSEKGCQGISFRKVAARVGCTTGTMTYYFENKEAMLIAATAHLFEEFEKMLEDEEGNIASVLDNWLKWSQRESSHVAPVMAELLVYARQEPQYASYLQQRYAQLRDLLAITLKQGQSRGLVRRDLNAYVLAEQLNALVDGWMLLSPLEPNRSDSKQIKEFFDATLKLIAP